MVVNTALFSVVGLVADDIMKKTIQDRISRLVVRLDPANSINSPVGGNYARHYETTLQRK